ncbi:hypothetical protein L2X98_09385 [Microbacterium elymi]|uniref:Uncharacterized protein n=1 Tax=Microbacterium elymi TaxID=2909587 RepID=A0ABY5NKQ9_9MICO|nr:hypothetical protein L2X98_09385 [Microbacterium elymi]
MTTTSLTAPPAGGKKAQVAVQRFGTFLSGMIMPNIAAFIAWGFITALFIATGWLGWWTPLAPVLGGFGNADEIGWQHAMTQLAQAAEGGATFPQYVGLVSPMITYLLPLLIANTGGRMVYGERGGVVASIATVGVIVGTTIPMFLGAMVMGPLAALLTKWMDRIWDGKIRPGFEMLVNNFSAGILGMILAIIGFFVFGPVMTWISDGLGAIVDFLVQHGVLPLLSIIVEPAKILFLNNAINHGVFTPIGTQAIARIRPLDPVPGRGQPRPGPGHPAGVHVLRRRRGTRLGPRCDRHPVPRRHPRDLLPVRADEADPGDRGDRRRHDRRRDQRDLRQRTAGAGGSRVDHRGADPDIRRQQLRAGVGVRRGHAVGDPRRHRVVPGVRAVPAAHAQAGSGHRGRRRSGSGHRADRGEQGQVVRRAVGSARLGRGDRGRRGYDHRRRGDRRRCGRRSSAHRQAGRSHRVRLRRRDGLVRDGGQRPAQQDQEGGRRGGHGGQPGHREPGRHGRPDHHAEPAHRPGPGEVAELDPCVGGQLHELAQVRRGRGPGARAAPG